MKNEKSPSELVKSYTMSKKKQDAALQEAFIDMVIHESILISKKMKLETQINQALDERNKPLFLKLSTDMNSLVKMFGS